MSSTVKAQDLGFWHIGRRARFTTSDGDVEEGIVTYISFDHYRDGSDDPPVFVVLGALGEPTEDVGHYINLDTEVTFDADS